MAMRHFALIAIALAAVSTAATVSSATKTPREPVLSTSAKRGLAIAQARCATCHAIKPYDSSPNPEAPSFDDIANREGLTSATLRGYLRDAHNYPDAMNFRIDRSQVRDLSAYIVTLKAPGHKQAI
ncbi:MAG: c-type cytochrome [Novosphingobium sp.]|jgi:mono/diheme cytochrome c family protein|nr:c-type cytochrome [Novosphingobium sp.]